MTIDHFSNKKTIGKGAFGTVKIGRHKQTGNVFAIKILEKKKIIESKFLKHTIQEKQILRTINQPFILKATYHFWDSLHLYLATEFCAGGDLHTLFNRNKNFKENHCMFYGAHIVLALEFLHSIKIIYRDLKLDNLLVNNDGYLKLVDFGISKKVENTTNSYCGTPSYIAPEMINQNDYNCSVDWWSFGVVLYKMGSGKRPFKGKSVNEIFKNIINNEIEMPESFSKTFADLVGKPLIKPPYISSLKDDMDTSNFGNYFEYGIDRKDTCIFYDEFKDFY
ncbi:hypothetical protein HELRODRAFT_156571 [Helobdella robusta]|uniref:Protein kinase domain-containing protein n=1 Tax=Helobdella robusta TaxID=6412 RepID=T1ELY5_HELRO|nr:hypothetical protein HELRODRAFT_156571 [Helobdella robusta]ESO09100.1 hypothetical protein HELRODRAFT_156571 [Helobdella robusta]